MKKTFLYIFSISALALNLYCTVNAQTNFTRAMAACENYSQKGIVVHQNEAYTIQVTLQKGRKDTCIYKEKITIGDNVHLLTCSFDKTQAKRISDIMSDFTEKHKQYMVKDPIFEAKLSTNAEIFQTYLTDRQFCRISGTQKKNK